MEDMIKVSCVQALHNQSYIYFMAFPLVKGEWWGLFSHFIQRILQQTGPGNWLRPITFASQTISDSSKCPVDSPIQYKGTYSTSLTFVSTVVEDSVTMPVIVICDVPCA